MKDAEPLLTGRALYRTVDAPSAGQQDGDSASPTTRHVTGGKASSNTRDTARHMKPTAPRTSYNLFVTERKPELHQSHPDISYKEMNAYLGKLWRSLSHTEKVRLNCPNPPPPMISLQCHAHDADITGREDHAHSRHACLYVCLWRLECLVNHILPDTFSCHIADDRYERHYCPSCSGCCVRRWA